VSEAADEGRDESREAITLFSNYLELDAPRSRDNETPISTGINPLKIKNGLPLRGQVSAAK